MTNLSALRELESRAGWEFNDFTMMRSALPDLLAVVEAAEVWREAMDSESTLDASLDLLRALARFDKEGESNG